MGNHIIQDDAMNNKPQRVVIVGNPVEGFVVVGPFASLRDSDDWCMTCDECTWGVAMRTPEEYDEEYGPQESIG